MVTVGTEEVMKEPLAGHRAAVGTRARLMDPPVAQCCSC